LLLLLLLPLLLLCAGLLSFRVGIITTITFFFDRVASPLAPCVRVG